MTESFMGEGPIALAKAMAIGGDRAAEPASRGPGEDLWAGTGAIDPPYDPKVLADLFEHASALRPNVDAYATNIDGFGSRFEPVLDFDSDDIAKKVSLALRIERAYRGESEREVGDAEVDATVTRLAHEARAERAQLEAFFESCCVEHSFVALRRKSRQDLEVTGNAYWEVLRTTAGRLGRFVYVPSYTVRLLPADERPVAVRGRVRTSPIGTDEVTTPRRLRRYVQVEGGPPVYFKQLGDPRVVSRKTGRVFASVEDLRVADVTDAPATEMLHLSIHAPASPYGVPRWIGSLLSVLGSREMEEVNLDYFANKSVPPLAVMVSGGSLGAGSLPRLETYMEENLKGKKGFHRILLLEVEPDKGGGGTRPKIELKPLTDAQQQDQLFGGYDTANTDKIGAAFRLPRIVRGDGREVNRACYSADTETLTEHGWKLYGEILDGERIAAFNPEMRTIEFHVPRARYAYEFSGDMVHFKSTSVDILVTPEHMMWLQAKERGGGEMESWRRIAAGDIPWSKYRFAVACESWQGRDEEWFALPHVPQGSHQHGPHPSIPFDLWIEFLGYYLSDGGLCQSPNAPSNFSVFIRQKKYAKQFRECAARFAAYGLRFRETTKRDGTSVFCAADKCLWTWLKTNAGGYSIERRIPREYLSLSSRQLTILCNAMMAGDGGLACHRGASARSYYTSSKELADGFQEMLIRLGIKAAVGRGQRIWRVNHVVSARTVGINARKNVRRFPYQGLVYCFEVPGHLFVTRRNGKVAIQGNSAEAALRFAEEQVFQPERDEFDHTINQILLNELGIAFWKFRSQAPVAREPERMTEMVERLVRVGVLTPEEGRQLAGDIFNRQFGVLDADWTKRPITLTLAGVQTSTVDLNPRKDDLGDDAKRLLALRNELAAEEERLAKRRMELAREYLMEGEAVDHVDE